MPTTFAPTTEQQACIDAAITGKSMVIEAGAGSGKTSTLRLVAEALAPKRGIYLAYNKAIQTDAERSFPDNVTCKTAHSVAYGWMMRAGGQQPALMAKLNRNVKPWEAAQTLGIPQAGFQGSERHIGAKGVASLVATTIGRFCNSAAESVTGRHVPREFEGDDQVQFETFVLPFARKAWADITSPNGALKFTHDHYLKLWSLATPRLNFDFILFDEAQDANPCIAHVVEAQAGQVIMVGDSAQAIYGWRGAVDAMANFKAEHRLTLSQSFRFGQSIADVANTFLALLNAPLRLTGFEAIASTVEPLVDADAILCRTNAAVIEYAMDAQRNGKAVAIVGGTKEIEAFAKNADKLITGKGMVTHPDLAGFDSWADVRTFSQQDDGRDLRVMVRMIDDYGVAAILDVCENSVSEASAEVIVSTAHKAKGREWDRVRIAADFKRSDDGELPAPAELMLMYVACTRAKLVLDHGALAFVAAIA